MPPTFENFLLDALNSEQKPSAKKRSTGPIRNQSTGGDFEIYRSGRENPDRFHLWHEQQSSKTSQDHNKRSGGPDTNIFELLMLKHNRTYLRVDSEESM